MRHPWLLLLASLACASQAAEVYQYIDEHGNRVFTDKPPLHVDAEEVHLPEVNRTQMPAPAARPAAGTANGPMSEAVTASTINGLMKMRINADNTRSSIALIRRAYPVMRLLRNVMTGKGVDKTFNAGVKVETATVDRRDMQYLYRDPAGFVFMDTDTYEQMTVPDDTLGDAGGFLVEGANVNLAMYGTEIVGVDLPAAVELEVAETEPGIQGDRVSGARKPATLQTGLVVQVPLFINIGDRLKVDTRSGDYITRA